MEALWQADVEARDLAAATAIAAMDSARTAALLNNQEILRETNEKLAAVASDRDSLADRVRRAADEVRSLAAAAATSQRGADVAAGIAARQAALDAAYDAYDRACQRDAVRFDALQREIKAQL